MRTIDQVKIGILIGAIAIWAWGAKTGNRQLMLLGIGLVIVAFALRLIRRPPNRDGP
jgi:hypothetical protein